MRIRRRTFLLGSAAVALVSTRRARADASGTVVLALMGANNRGSQLAERFAKVPGVEFAYVCDPDERAIAKGIDAAASGGRRRPTGVKDFRRALDDPAIDGLVCAAPNHWHAAATVLACAAGKHVYVEKPCSQTPDEGERMIAAAERAKRVVQVGVQRRSGPLYREAMARIHDGVIGDVLLAKGWYYADRPSIGRGQEVAVPAWLDYDLWQGPAPERPYRDNLIHYNWHWFWHWGNGELGNNGVHTIDLARWALGVDFPTRVTAMGGRYRFDDDQQTPDTHTVTWDCGGKLLVWEGLSWTTALKPMPDVGVELRGSNGSMVVTDAGCSVYDPAGKLVDQTKGSRGDTEHLENFLAAVRGDASVNSSIVEGHRSALMCHLGNMAYRLEKPLEIDATTGRPRDVDAMAKYWSREYRPGWLPTATV